MSGHPLQVVTLVAYEPCRLPAEALPAEAVAWLWQHHSHRVQIEPPSFKTQGQWQLTAQGWAGYIPLTPNLALALVPRLPIPNLFRLLAYAYDLAGVCSLDGCFQAASLPEFYGRLACLLAEGVLARLRQGIHQAYLVREGRQTFLRGQLRTKALAQRPWEVGVPCRYQEFTPDVAENQILAWTLHTILRGGFCQGEEHATVLRAFRRLAGGVTLRPFTADDCRGRVYHRLTQDYRPLHALCAFFLAQQGPAYQEGDWEMVPFLVDVGQLFERFVAAWLRQHLEPSLRVAVQERCPIDPAGNRYFTLDLVIYDTRSGRPRWILDTKYKPGADGPAPEDIAQVLAYAQAKGARDAALVYPMPLAQPLDTVINGIRVRSLTFDLTQDLTQAGEDFLRALLSPCSPHV
ncbi:McrC family protein [Litorilinea aerophila]|uniref:Restriction endonuclease n=1 Tax=Litorilinea aerophila TaxID=1204385 RepID=A0A540VDR7_9CHLR|nr:restriction endonuclease [Litorilinea aerophila]MCC9077350.1 McrC family protein [Litorilinea aerophila]GIV76221.1 MAG: hypothetical protein KatS3mg050_0615 [Litorilinea sp.]